MGNFSFGQEILNFLSGPVLYVAIALVLSILWLIRRGGRGSYEEYLRSQRWEELRRQTMTRDNGRCRICNRANRLQVHHRRYPAIWGRETVDDLTTLCAECHATVSHSGAQERIYGR